MENPWMLIPEFVGVFVGMVTTWITTGIYVVWSRRPSHRERVANINRHLALIGMGWSINEARIKPLSEMNPQTENQKEARFFLLAGIVLSIASWLGFIVLSVLILSLEILAKPRLERAVFASPLADSRKLSAQEVRDCVSHFPL